MTRLLIADDHTLMREGLKKLFAMLPDIQLVGEAVNGEQALARLEEGGVDLLLLDWAMPGLAGDDLIRALRRRWADLPILVLSMHAEPSIAAKALGVGANGYLTKDQDPDTLIHALRAVAAGGTFLDPTIAGAMMFDVHPGDARLPHETLSPRERQIFMHLARGEGVNDIARILAISNKTVSTHKARLMDKLKFANNADLVRYAMRHGLVK